MSNLCKNCGGETIELFLSRACKRECDLKLRKREGYKVSAIDEAHGTITLTMGTPQFFAPVGTAPSPYVVQPKTDLQLFEEIIRDALANPPPGMGFMTLKSWSDRGSHLYATFIGNSKSGFIQSRRPPDRDDIVPELIKLSQML